MIAPHIIPMQHFKYNPYSIVEANNSLNQFSSMSMHTPHGFPSLGPKSKPEMILYDPIKSALKERNDEIKIRNVAQPGSLIKVWEGTLDIGTKTEQFQC